MLKKIPATFFELSWRSKLQVLLALIFSLMLTAVFSFFALKEAEATQRNAFALRAADITNLLDERMHAYRVILRGAAGIALAVPHAEKSMRIEQLRSEGLPNVDIFPHGEWPLYFPIVLLEPFSGCNLRAVGFDMYAEPRRRAAMVRARYRRGGCHGQGAAGARNRG